VPSPAAEAVARFPPGIRVYVVGGAVRDQLLGLPIQDRDHVVVGAHPEDMLNLGFRPVGKDFPVFLHPHSREEYALARTERKTAPGYKGFVIHAAPDVSLEEDLRRRDLTINAMALDGAGALIDPYGGRADLGARMLRHVSAAFSEDPVRILRVARFAARLPDFDVAPETMSLMHQMVSAGEVDALVPERIWQELARGLMEQRPSRLITVLRQCGALARILPEVDRLFGVPQDPRSHPEVDTGDHVLRVMDVAASLGADLGVRWSALLHDVGKGLTPEQVWPDHAGHEAAGTHLVEGIGRRLRVPVDCTQLARVVCAWHGQVHRALHLGPDALLDLLENTDAVRRPQRFERVLLACLADCRGRPGQEGHPFPQADHLRRALTIVRNVDAGLVARQVTHQNLIAEAIRHARLLALEQEPTLGN